MTAIVKKNPLADGADWPTGPSELADFHHRMPAYAPTILLDAPRLAERFGVGRVVVKAETKRMGLPSFKILGASWATYRAICAHIGREPEPWTNINELAANLAFLKPFKLATATDGNHGRAVSFMARLLGVPRGVRCADGRRDRWSRPAGPVQEHSPARRHGRRHRPRRVRSNHRPTPRIGWASPHRRFLNPIPAEPIKRYP